MNLPDCYDPAVQEDRRQAEYDAECEAFPHCDECGGSLYPHDTYTEIGGHLYCEKCIRLNTHLVDNLEVA